MEAFTTKDLEIIERKTEYKGYIEIQELKLRHRLFAGGFSKILSRELVIRSDAVGVLLFDPHLDKVVLISQIRIGAIKEQNPWLLEIIAGVMDKEEESPEKVAHRESQEEAGCTITELMSICNFYPSPGGSAEKIHLFCGLMDSTTLSEGVYGNPEEGEDIMVYIVPREKAYEMIQQGKIINSISIIALQWLQLNIEQVRRDL